MGSPPDAYEPARLDRAMHLAVVRLGPGQYAVQGSHGVRYVDLLRDPPCDCEDMEYRNAAGTGWCKHALAARLQERDPQLVEALGQRLLARAQHTEG